MTQPRAKVFFALYLCAIVYLSLFPGRFELHPQMDRLLWAPITGRRQALDFVLNVLFYVPLGASGCLALRRRAYGFLVAVLFGCGLSWTVEWLQLWTPTRYGNLTDLTSNSLGTVLGAGAAFAASRWLRGTGDLSAWAMTPRAWLFFAVWIFWQTFPFVPRIVLRSLTDLPSLLAPWSWHVSAETLLGSLVLSLVLGRSPWMLIAFAALPAQAFLLSRSLSPPALCGAIGGWWVARLETLRCRQWLGLVLPVWLLFEELRPFSLAEHPHAFGWAPFVSWYEVASIEYYPTIFGKLFLYLGVIWSLRERGVSRLWAVGIPALILACGEWAQQYLEGRTPESTDLVLLVAGAVLLELTEFRVEGGKGEIERVQ